MKLCNEESNHGYVVIDVWCERIINTFGVVPDEAAGPGETFGASGWTLTSGSCWEESPGSRAWNNGLLGRWGWYERLGGSAGPRHRSAW